LIEHHGISRQKFLSSIKEMVWRYNKRGIDLFEYLVDVMLDETVLVVEVT
jgi:hypothetical protein